MCLHRADGLRRFTAWKSFWMIFLYQRFTLLYRNKCNDIGHYFQGISEPNNAT